MSAVTVNPSLVVHPALAAISPLTGVLASRRPLWTPDELGRLTAVLVEIAGETLRGVAEHHAEHRWWTRLALTEEVEVWLLGWSDRQGTRLHGHGGAAGAYTVLDGALAENFRDGPGPLRRGTVAAGAASAFGPDRVHVVANPGPGNATSVHAYSPPLLPLNYLSADDR